MKKVFLYCIIMVTGISLTTVSCKKDVGDSDKNADSQAALDTLSMGEEGFGESLYDEGGDTGDSFEVFDAYDMRYSIAYLGTINDTLIEMNIAYSTESDSVWGNYFEDKGECWLGHDIKGVAATAGYKIGVDNYKGAKAHLTLKPDGYGNLSGTYKRANNGTIGGVSLTAQQDVRQSNTQLEYNYRVGLVKEARGTEDPPGESFNRLHEIAIFDSDKKHLQTIRFDEDYVYETKGFATLQDMNFDGYLDLNVELFWPLAVKDAMYHSYYLYNPETGRFDESNILNGLHWVQAYYSKKEIQTGDANGNGYDYTGSYKWIDKKLYLVKEVIMQPEDDKIYHKEYTVQNGKSILTREYTK